MSLKLYKNSIAHWEISCVNWIPMIQLYSCSGYATFFLMRFWKMYYYLMLHNPEVFLKNIPDYISLYLIWGVSEVPRLYSLSLHPRPSYCFTYPKISWGLQITLTFIHRNPHYENNYTQIFHHFPYILCHITIVHTVILKILK